MNWSCRSEDPELIDLGPDHYTREEYADCMRKLGRVGRLLGGDRAGLRAFRGLSIPPKSILDVGCGGGWFARRLAQAYPEARVVGEDFSAEAITVARAHLARHPLPNLVFKRSDDLTLTAEENSVDVVTATLVCHHMNDPDLVEFFRRACRVARRAVVVNDLHRHPAAYALFRMVAPVLFRNRLICSDGPLSIRRAFVREDWDQILQAAGIPLHGCRIAWRWAFRWIVVVEPTA